MASKLQEIPTWMPVVAAAITRGDGAMLLHKRPAGKQHAGLWEFPGGKVEAGEIPPIALVREIREELGLELDPAALEPATFAERAGEGGQMAIVILLYRALRWQGEPQALEGNEWGWFTIPQAAKLAMPPLDIELLARLSWRSQG